MPCRLGLYVSSLLFKSKIYKNVKFIWVNANGHITLKAPVLVRSLKLSSVELGQYLDGWPPGNTECCWQHFFVDLFFISIFFSFNLYYKVIVGCVITFFSVYDFVLRPIFLEYLINYFYSRNFFSLSLSVCLSFSLFLSASLLLVPLSQFCSVLYHLESIKCLVG